VRLEAEVQRVKAESEKAVAERVRLEAEVQLVKAEGEKTEANESAWRPRSCSSDSKVSSISHSAWRASVTRGRRGT